METLQEKDDALNAAEALIDQRLGFLKAYANGLVPDPSEGISVERRAELKKEEEEMKTRINELELLQKQMRNN